MASCRQLESLLQAYVDGELGSSERVVLEQHLNECSGCVQALRAHQANAAHLFEVLSEHRLHEDLQARVMAHLPEMEAAHQSHLRRDRFAQTRSWSQRVSGLVPAFVPAVLLLLAIALFVFWPPIQAPGRSVGMVVQTVGTATRSHEELPDWRRVGLATPVIQNEWLRTADSAGLMVAMGEHSQLKLDGGTRVRVLGERRIALESGRAWLNVSKDDQQFRVTTPYGNVTVFGTTFEVAVKEDVAMITVASGLVRVANDVTYTEVRPGEQVELVLERTPLKPKPADAESVMAWAHRIQPDTDAQVLFEASVVDRHPSRVVKAEQVFVVTPKDRNLNGINALKLMWKPDFFTNGHSGYDVFISDTNMNPLSVKHLDSSVFQDKSINSFVLELDSVIQGVSVLHIKLVPDTSTGRIETSFEMEALGR